VKANGIVVAVAVGSALSLGTPMATAPANGDPAADLTIGRTIDHNPLSDYGGYCTWVSKNRYTPIPATTSKRSPEMPKPGQAKPKRQAGR
jgi:hypothetical protein